MPHKVSMKKSFYFSIHISAKKSGNERNDNKSDTIFLRINKKYGFSFLFILINFFDCSILQVPFLLVLKKRNKKPSIAQRKHGHSSNSIGGRKFLLEAP